MLGPKDIETEIWNATAKAGTLIVPGSWFQPDPTLTLEAAKAIGEIAVTRM